MAIYRRSSRRPLVIVGVMAAILGLVVGLAIGRGSAPDLASQVRAARAEATPILTALDVVQSEYPKLLAASADSDPGGAPSAITRAQSQFATHQAEFAVIDPAGTGALNDGLTKLATLISAKAAEADVDEAIVTAKTAANRLAGTAVAS